MAESRLDDSDEYPDPTGAITGRHDVIRSEERLRPTTEVVPIERVRLEKYIVSEQRTITVTVRREEVRVVRSAIRDPSTSDVPTDVDRSPVMVLHEEQVVVTMEAVPVERVWLQKERVREQQTVIAELRSERIELDRNG